jgi:AcrR family transcriptional regulator
MTKVSSQQIAAAARELFRNHGFAGASMQDLADQVGIRKASLYSRFPDKDALIGAVLDITLAELFPAPDAGTPPEPTQDFAAAIQRLAAHLRDHRRCVALHLAYGLSGVDGQAHPQVAAFFDNCRERLRATLLPRVDATLADELAADTILRLEGATLWLALYGDCTPLERAVSELLARAEALCREPPSPAVRAVLDGMLGDWRLASAAEWALAARLADAEERVLFVEQALRGQIEAASCFL